MNHLTVSTVQLLYTVKHYCAEKNGPLEVLGSRKNNPLGLFLCNVFNTTVSPDAGIESRTVAVYAMTSELLTVRQYLTHQ
jgi:hypothetical protein